MGRKYWNRIKDFDAALVYVNRLGFNVKPGFPGWIIACQKRLCDTVNALFKAAGGYPFDAHYSRKSRRFYVRRQDGVIDVVKAGRL